MNDYKYKLLSNKWVSILAFLGFFGLVPKPNGNSNYCFFIFFSFFSWYWWTKIQDRFKDKQFESIVIKVKSYLFILPLLLSFFILFFLDRQTNPQIILRFGSIGYSIIFIMFPIILCYLDSKNR